MNLRELTDPPGPDSRDDEILLNGKEKNIEIRPIA